METTINTTESPIESPIINSTRGSIYMITNTTTGEKYIGQTIQEPYQRWRGHLKNARRLQRFLSGEKVDSPNIPKNSYLYNSMASQKVENFEFKVLEEEVPENDLNDLEIRYISEYNTLRPNGYNFKIGGGGGHHHTENTKQLMSTLAKEKASKILDKYRKEETQGLPMYIVSHNKGNSHGFAVCGHPLCSYKSFTLCDYATMDDCKAAACAFLADLETKGEVYKPIRKNDESLPKGISTIEHGFLARRRINGKLHSKAFRSKKMSMEDKKQAAIAFLATLPQ